MAFRLPLLALAVLALLAGLCGGMWRVGWALPHGAALAALHGPLLVSGLFGTLIGLERAVAMGRDWPYAAPALSAIGTLALLAGAPTAVGAGAYAAAAAALAGASLMITIQQPALFTGALLFGALAWLAGNVLWLLGDTVPQVAGWWLAFLVLTIGGERLELSRLMPARRDGEAAFLFIIGLLLVGARNGLTTPNGAILFGSALLALAAWLFRHDLARRNIRQAGQTRFMAACMLSGYLWLGLAGAMLLAFPPGTATFGYDAAVHAVLIGFVLSMVFGHALVILPAVTRLRVAYTPRLYGPLALLHASLVMRVAADLLEWPDPRRWSGIGAVAALVAFALVLAAARKPSPRQEAPAGRP
jgi:hypothetical protein